MTTESPNKPDPMKIYEAAAECWHAHGIHAASCADCRHPDNWFLSRTKNGPLADVVRQLIADGHLSDEVELYDPGLKRSEFFSFKKLVALTGIAIVGGFVAYKTAKHGQTLGLRLIKAVVDKVTKKK